MATVCITLGQGAEFYIDDLTGMGIRKQVRGEIVDDVHLGPATEKNLDTILLHMGSLRIHTQRN